jgi:hypothetical protein
MGITARRLQERGGMRWWLAALCAGGFALVLAGGVAAEPYADPCSVPPDDAGGQSGPLDCFLVADSETFLSRSQALTLCSAAPSAAPAECFVRARRELMISDQQAIELCRCARSATPVDCYADADRETFLSTSQIVRLCGPIYAEGLLPSCRPAGAYHHPPGPPIEITP